ncbi:hypothetical protein GGQ60_004266 [Pedobacter zeae]|uniref:Uncharacterized protein n=1 Tax=Pedobacter zeae TaxID=1737356 RepID=A0A7W6KE99_9SPHI|nr:hypothetical protein [Pedobacter zeae]
MYEIQVRLTDNGQFLNTGMVLLINGINADMV